MEKTMIKQREDALKKIPHFTNNGFTAASNGCTGDGDLTGSPGF